MKLMGWRWERVGVVKRLKNDCQSKRKEDFNNKKMKKSHSITFFSCHEIGAVRMKELGGYEEL